MTAPTACLPHPLVKTLVDHHMAVSAGSAPAAIAKAHHLSASAPVNAGVAHDREQIQSWQDNAVKARFDVLDHSLRACAPSHRERSFEPTITSADEQVTPDVIRQLILEFYAPAERPYASAGGLYPVHLIGEHPVVGLVRLDRVSHQIITTGPDKNGPTTTTNNDDPSLHATGGRVWLVADIEPGVLKYGPRGYRYALIEAGAAAHYLSNLAAGIGLAVRPFGGYDDSRVAAALQLTDNQLPVHCLGIRRKSDGHLPADQHRVAVQAVRVGNTPVHLATAWSPTVTDPPLTGQAADVNPSLAIARAVSELTERTVLDGLPPAGLNSNGFASHVHPNAAMRNAALELYERHCLLRQWFLQLRPERLVPQLTSTDTGLTGFARALEVDFHYAVIADPAYEIPAVLAVIRSRISGAILLGSAASNSWAEAAARAGAELLKAVVHRWARMKRHGEPLFEPHRQPAGTVRHPGEHESFWANDDVDPVETAVYKMPDHLAPTPTDPPELRFADFLGGCAFEQMPTVNLRGERRYTFRAHHPRLIPAIFGPCTRQYAELVIDRINVDPRQRWPHPLG